MARHAEPRGSATDRCLEYRCGRVGSTGSAGGARRDSRAGPVPTLTAAPLPRPVPPLPPRPVPPPLAAPAPSSAPSSAPAVRLPEVVPPAVGSRDAASAQKAEKVSGIISAFRAFDADGSGTMDRGELSRLCWTLNAAFSEEDMDKLFKEVDANGDGLIQYEEFIQWLFGDDTALTRLQAKSTVIRTPSRLVRIPVKMLDGRESVLQAQPEETVQHLRLRACDVLRLPVEKYHDLHLTLASSGETLSDATPAGRLRGQELLASLDAGGCFFGALRESRVVVRWRATPNAPEELTRYAAPAEVRALCPVPGAAALCALCGGGGGEGGAPAAAEVAEVALAWEAATGRELWRRERASVFNAIACSSKVLYAGMEDGSVIAWDAGTGDELWVARSKDSVHGIKALHVSPQSLGVVSAATDSGRVSCWSAKTGEKRWEAKHGRSEPEVQHIAGASREDASSPWALFTGGTAGLVCCWDVRSGTLKWKVQYEGSIQALCYRELYDTICVAPREGQILSLDGRTGEKLFEEDVGQVRLMQGRRQNLFVATPKGVASWDTLNRIRNWEVEAVPARPAGSPPAGAGASRGRSGSRAGSRGTIAAATAASALSASPVPGAGVSALVYVEDVDMLCISTAEGLVVYDAKRGKLCGSLPVSGGVQLLAYTPPL